jgi:hypothetical protein
MKTLDVLLLLTATLWGAALQNAPASVQGVVLKAGASEPLSETAVELSLSSGGATRYTTVTDASGHFLFNGVSPGDYRLAASRTGYLRSL